MAITRTPIHDDDGSGTTGTIINNAWKQELYDQIDGAIGGLEVLSVGAGGNVSLGAGFLTHVINLTPGAGVGIAITWSGGAAVDGERVILYGRSAGWATVAHGGAVSNIATSAPTPISTNGAAIYTRVAGVWMLTAHEQGAWITQPYAAANFIGDVGTWTVEAADVGGLSSRLSGRTLSVSFNLGATSVAGGPNWLQIQKAAYGGFTTAGGGYGAIPYALDAFAAVAAYAAMTASSIACIKTAGAAWGASANQTYLRGTIITEVQ